MELSLSKTELKVLVELAIMADWTMTAHDTEDDPRKEKYLQLLQKIYAFAHENGMKKEVVKDPELDMYLPETDWEDATEARGFIDEFENMSFWTELVNKFADREMKKKFKGRQPKTFDEQLDVFQHYSDIFAEEFDEHGISRLEVKKESKKEK